MPNEIIQFPFKGDRTYVHGTSLLSFLIKKSQDTGIQTGRIDVSFKNMIHNPTCILHQRTATKEDSVSAKITGPSAEILNFCITEASSPSTPSKVIFDEVKITTGATIKDKRIIQDPIHHPDMIEVMVALCKKMHQECIDKTKKWVFSRYDGIFPIPHSHHIEIAIKKQIGTRLTCSTIHINGELIGNIYFS